MSSFKVQEIVSCCRSECNSIISRAEPKPPGTEEVKAEAKFVSCEKCKAKWCSEACLQKDAEHHAKYCHPAVTLAQKRVKLLAEKLVSEPQTVYLLHMFCSVDIGTRTDKILVIPAQDSFEDELNFKHPFSFSRIVKDLDKLRHNLSANVKDLDKEKGETLVHPCWT